jgi:acyl carrier protein
MERSEIEAKIVGLLVRQRGVDPGAVRPESRLEEDLGLDSLAMLDLILGLEEACGVSLPDEVAERITTVGEAVDAVAGLAV